MRVFERVTEARTGKEGRRGANRSSHYICDIVFVCLWGKHPLSTCAPSSRFVTGKQTDDTRTSRVFLLFTSSLLCQGAHITTLVRVGLVKILIKVRSVCITQSKYG